MLKAEECLKQEEERVDGCFSASSKPKLLREVESELLAKYEADLLAKEHSGAAALLRDDKVGCLPHSSCSNKSQQNLAPTRRCRSCQV
jgi:hypothetical protein